MFSHREMHREILSDFTGFFTMNVLIVKYNVKSLSISLPISRWSREDIKKRRLPDEAPCVVCMILMYQPHRAVSMGMICFFLDMTPGRNTSLSLGSTENAYLMVSSFPK